MPQKPRQNLVGRVFTRLTVLEPGDDYIDPRTGRHTGMWQCQCSCGKRTVVRSDSLLKGNTKSCGCYSLEVRRQCGEFWSRSFKSQRKGRVNVSFHEALTSNDF